MEIQSLGEVISKQPEVKPDSGQKPTTIELVNPVQLGHPGYEGTAYRVSGIVKEPGENGEEVVTYITPLVYKEFTEELPPDFAQRLEVNYQAAKAAGLTVLPTYWLVEKDGRMHRVMTDLTENGTALLLTNNNALTPEDFDKLTKQNPHLIAQFLKLDLNQVAKNYEAELAKATQAKIEIINEDYGLKLKDGTAPEIIPFDVYSLKPNYHGSIEELNRDNQKGLYSFRDESLRWLQEHLLEYIKTQFDQEYLEKLGKITSEFQEAYTAHPEQFTVEPTFVTRFSDGQSQKVKVIQRNFTDETGESVRMYYLYALDPYGRVVACRNLRTTYSELLDETEATDTLILGDDDKKYPLALDTTALSLLQREANATNSVVSWESPEPPVASVVLSNTEKQYEGTHDEALRKDLTKMRNDLERWNLFYGENGNLQFEDGFGNRVKRLQPQTTQDNRIMLGNEEIQVLVKEEDQTQVLKDVTSII